MLLDPDGMIHGPAACLYRVNLGFKNEDDDRPVMPSGPCRSLTVVAKNAEAAIVRARARFDDEQHGGNPPCIVSVELVDGIDVP